MALLRSESYYIGLSCVRKKDLDMRDIRSPMACRVAATSCTILKRRNDHWPTSLDGRNTPPHSEIGHGTVLVALANATAYLVRIATGLEVPLNWMKRCETSRPDSTSCVASGKKRFR